MKKFLGLSLALFLIVTFTSCTKSYISYHKAIPNKTYSKGAISFIPLGEGMLNPNSAWGSIGITESGLIYVMVSDHITNSGIFEYNTGSDKLFYLGTVSEKLALFNRFERQPKVHTPLYQYSQDGIIYFGTDAGDWSGKALYDHFDEGYSGGHLASLNPITKEVVDLGLIQRFGGTKCLLLDNNNGLLYFNASPSCNFYKYDIKKKDVKNLGRVNGYKTTRTLFLDKWDNVYNTTETGNLVRYNLEKDTLEYLDDFLPGRSPTGPSQVVYGPNKDFIIGIDGYSGTIFKYIPNKSGNGKMNTLGNVFNKRKLLVRNLNFHDNKLYFIATSREEIPYEKRSAEIIVFDIKEKKVVKSVKLDKRIQQAFGHSIVDKSGNMYVCGFWDASDYILPNNIKSRVYLLKFNPSSF